MSSKKSEKVRGSYCSVVECKNNRDNSPGTTFYSYPKSIYKQEQRNKWIQAVRRINPDGSDWQPTKNSVICSQHFIGNKKSEHPHSPSFVPSIFPPVYGGYKGKSSENYHKHALDRFNRCLSRQKLKQTEKENASVETMDLEMNVLVHLETSTNKETQVNFLTDEEFGISKLFVCNRTLYHNEPLSGTNVCDAEIQTCIQLCTKKKKVC